jgi:hypothetical protein
MMDIVVVVAAFDIKSVKSSEAALGACLIIIVNL